MYDNGNLGRIDGFHDHEGNDCLGEKCTSAVMAIFPLIPMKDRWPRCMSRWYGFNPDGERFIKTGVCRKSTSAITILSSSMDRLNMMYFVFPFEIDLE